MAGTKIKLKDQLGRVVRVGGDATKGATVGRDLRWPDGSLVQESQVRNGVGSPTSGSTGNASPTVWRLIREVPENLRQLAALDGEGGAYRNADGSWELRRSGRAVIDFSYGDATPSVLYVPDEDVVLTGVRLAVGTAFNGAGAALSVGSSALPDLYLPASEVDPAIAAGYESIPDAFVSAGESIYLHITPGSGASAGAGRAILNLIPVKES